MKGVAAAFPIQGQRCEVIKEVRYLWLACSASTKISFFCKKKLCCHRMSSVALTVSLQLSLKAKYI